MKTLANRLSHLETSATLAMASKAKALKAKGVDVVDMSLGEPDFNTPAYLKEAAIKAIEEGNSFYTPVPGTLELRKAICHKLKRDNNIEAEPSQVVVSTGAKQAISNIIMALINPGDEVVIPAPYWVSYADIVKFMEGKVISPLAGVEQDYKITPKQLKESLTSKTKLFIFSNPSNPTGSVYNEEELRGLAQIFKEFPDCYIVSDEIYEYILFQENYFSLGSLPELAHRVITVNGLSKAFAMTGWRLGYLTASKEIADACISIQSQCTSGTNSITQVVAITALNQGKEPVSFMKESFFKRRNLFISELTKIKNIHLSIPHGAFYLFIDFKLWVGKKYKNILIQDCTHLSNLLLENVYLALTPGAAFGAPGHLRFSYATSEERIREAVKRLESFQEDLS